MPSKSFSITLKSRLGGTYSSEKLGAVGCGGHYYLHFILTWRSGSFLTVSVSQSAPALRLLCKQQEAEALPLTPLVSALMRATVAALCPHTRTHAHTLPTTFDSEVAWLLCVTWQDAYPQQVFVPNFNFFFLFLFFFFKFFLSFIKFSLNESYPIFAVLICKNISLKHCRMNATITTVDWWGFILFWNKKN